MKRLLSFVLLLLLCFISEARAVPPYDHVVIVLEENHGFSQIVGSGSAPYINNTLIAGGASLTNYFADTHPSQPNYFIIYGGSSFGVADDNPVSEPDPSLATVIQGAGKAFIGFAESGSPQKHNPWESFPEGTTVEQDFGSQFPTTPTGFANLPAVSFVSPNLTDDMHDGTIAQGDTWLQSNIDAYAQWAKTHNSLLIVVWDEDDSTGNNQVPAILYGANVVTGTYNGSFDHFNMCATLATAAGATCPRTTAAAISGTMFTTGTPPSVPTALHAANVIDTSLTLSWNASTGTAPITYNVLNRVTGTVPFTTVAAGVSGLSTTISNLSPRTSYDFEVTATGPGGTSAPSAVLTVATAATVNGAVLPGGYLLASGSQLVSGTGVNARMACVNADNSLPADVAAMRSAGFNCLRYSWWDARLPAAASTPGSLLAMDAMVSAATAANMRVIFVHRGNEGSATDGCLKQQHNGLWYDQNSAAPYTSTNNTNGCGTTGTITYQTFSANWVNIATRYNGNTTVIGFDLHHEPLVKNTAGAAAATWAAGNICGNCGTDVSGMCSDVGTKINAANSGVLIICEGPLNNGTTYLNGTALNAVAGTGFTESDLTMAASSPVAGFPVNKLVYSAHDYPCNVGASCPSSGAANITAKNTAWGYLVTANTAPVFIGELGCSCDGTNGQQTDDTNWATAITQYVNGQTQTLGGTGGPTFTGTQLGVSTAWWDWGNQNSNPNGVLLAGGAFNPNQRGFWLTLLMPAAPVAPPPPATTWNPNDKSAITLSGNNLIATSAASTSAVRVTTSKSSGKVCWEVAATTITNDWTAGLANASYVLSNTGGLGSDNNGISYDANFGGGGGSGFGIFMNNAVLSFASTATTDANGAKMTECADFGAQLIWMTSPGMRALGSTWNNSGTANPATGTGGISFSGLVCPCFIAYQNIEAGVATLNTTGPFAVATPAGFQTWDTQAATPIGRILLINLGANDTEPAANDNWRHPDDNDRPFFVALNGER